MRQVTGIFCPFFTPLMAFSTTILASTQSPLTRFSTILPTKTNLAVDTRCSIVSGLAFEVASAVALSWIEHTRAQLQMSLVIITRNYALFWLSSTIFVVCELA